MNVRQMLPCSPVQHQNDQWYSRQTGIQDVTRIKSWFAFYLKLIETHYVAWTFKLTTGNNSFCVGFLLLFSTVRLVSDQMPFICTRKQVHSQ